MLLTNKKTIHSELKRGLSGEITRILEEEVKPNIIKVIMDSYDDYLMGRPFNEDSRLRPEFYRSIFMDRLSEFNFIDYGVLKFSFKLPDMDSFDFDNGLELIKLILEGIPGKVSEISGEDYILAAKKQVYVGAYYTGLIYKDRSYLMDYNSADKLLKKLNKDAILYPFSNQRPIDIFESAQELLSKASAKIKTDLITFTKNSIV